MKKVGILTLYYKTYNFGAQLQAYALQQTVEKLGYECEQIRFVWSCEQTIENYSNASIDQNAFSTFSKRIKHSKRIYNSSNISDCLEEYDAFIVGSDQVWGVENSMPLINLPVMALSFVPNNKLKIAYAASFGSSKPSSAIEEILKLEIPQFDAISMREESGAKYLEKTINRKVETVLDPVMLVSRDSWDNIGSDCITEKEEYVLYYTAGADSIQERILTEIHDTYHLPVKRLGYISGEQAGPMEFINLIKNAKYVVTDSFHATVFSILYNKNFVVLPVDMVPTDRSKNARLLSLLNTFELSERFVDYHDGSNACIEKLIGLLNENIRYDSAENILELERSKSLDFLKTALLIRKVENNYLAKHNDCTGCGICSLVCPTGAIKMEKGELGFVYPIHDKEKCINCGKCTNVCVNNFVNDTQHLMIGLQSIDDMIREKSSSGGVFYELACYVIKIGGIVAACRFDENYNVIHDFCFSISELDAFCRSKYVQSDAYKIFAQTKKYLLEGRTVLFVGTPCQIAALSNYLCDEYENLYTIDLICGGVGAPGLWDKYLEYKKSFGDLKSINMRNKYSEYLKPEGFPAFSMKIDYSTKSEVYTGIEDYYLRSRLNYYRESCYHCENKSINRCSDITIGDFVGMNKNLRDEYDAKGTTLVMVRTSKGKSLLESCSERLKCIDIPDAKVGSIIEDNPMYSEQMKKKPQFYYMRSVYKNSSIERIFQEDKYWDEFGKSEAIIKNLFNEIKRNDLMLKTERAISYRLWLDEDPKLIGKIFIYGAGKLGRSLIKCIHSISGFIDGNSKLKSCEGIAVYHMNTDMLKEKLGTGKNATIIVTPIWDYEIIAENAMAEFPEINVISAKDLVGNIWI